jgi:hypothetical protein
MNAKEMHHFSDLFDKALYMFRTGPLFIIRSISTLYKIISFYLQNSELCSIGVHKPRAQGRRGN